MAQADIDQESSIRTLPSHGETRTKDLSTLASPSPVGSGLPMDSLMRVVKGTL